MSRPKLRLTTLAKRRIRGDLIKTYKIVKDKVQCECFFQPHISEYNTRGHRLNWLLQEVDWRRQNFLSQRVIHQSPLEQSIPDHVQGRPGNVKHDARCVMGKLGGKTKNPNRRGDFNLLL